MHSGKIENLTKSSEEFVINWNRKYSAKISEYFLEQTEILSSIRENIIKLNDSLKQDDALRNKKITEFHQSNLSLLNSLYTELKTKAAIKEFTLELRSSLLKEIQSIEGKVKDNYSGNTGHLQEGVFDHPFLKKTGDLLYLLGKLPQKAWLKICKLLKISHKPVKKRTHIIYANHIIRGFLLNDYITMLQEQTRIIQEELIRYASALFELESRLIESNYQITETPDPIKEFPSVPKFFNKTDSFFDAYANKLKTLFAKSGTWELPAFKIKYLANQNLKSTFEKAEATYRVWTITFFALYEDWRFREELFRYIFSIRSEADQTINNYTTKLHKTLNPVISGKKNYLELLISRIPDADHAEVTELKHFFTSELYHLQKETREQTLGEALLKTKTEIEKLLHKIEIDVFKALELFPEKSGVVRSPDYQKGIRRAEIYFFSPSEFIEFECIPSFLDRIKALLDDFSTNFQEVTEEFNDFDQITDFTLDTAVSMINAQNSPEQTLLMFREGLQRSLNILHRIEELSNETLFGKEKELNEAFSDFYKQVEKLDNNDRILSIYSNLLRSKAIQKSLNNRRKLTNFVVTTAADVATFSKKVFNTIISFHQKIRKKLKLDKGPLAVSSEISNYLAEINRRIFELPVIYRHLFENAPVKETNLFLYRQPELKRMEDALMDWKSGNFAATLLIGENGAGKSSLLQYFLKTAKGGSKIMYRHLSRFYYSESDFYELMQEIFDNPGLRSEKEVQEHIKSFQGQQIVALDGIERTFLRKPGGFDCLHKLLSLIVSTNKHIFWVCSVSLHACNYLDKTVSIKENFDYLINLNSLSSDEIKNIILKRHRLSGYLVSYEDDSRQEENSKKPKERQIQLEKEFFNSLNRFAESNLSLALYFWLESVSKFTDNDLYIKRFKTPDFSFLETLSPEKIYTLLLIVLHGRITTKLHAEIFNQQPEISFKILTILREDSIIIRRGDHYILNGILYRHVTQLLKNKNLIH